jgi:hypothetical protein
MADSIFDFVAGELERRTDLARLEARGTVRLALKEAGLDARGVTREQMLVTLEKILPGEIRTRGVEQPDPVCEAICSALKSATLDEEPSGDESPEAVFRRLARS